MKKTISVLIIALSTLLIQNISAYSLKIKNDTKYEIAVKVWESKFKIFGKDICKGGLIFNERLAAGDKKIAKTHGGCCFDQIAVELYTDDRTTYYTGGTLSACYNDTATIKFYYDKEFEQYRVQIMGTVIPYITQT